MAERRRQYYTDQKIQGYLLIALVALEILLVAGMLYFMYSEINVVIESHLFRIHPREEGAWPELFQVLLKVIGVFLVINILVLGSVHLLWSRYIRNTIRRFSLVVEKIEMLDFSPLEPAGQHLHSVAELVELWFEKERARDQRLNSLVGRLDSFGGRGWSADERQELNSILQEYRRLLLAE